MRIVGIDVARAVALIAMVAAHLTVTGANTLGIVGQLLYGFPAALFAFLAGISMSLMRPHPVTFLVRGLILIILHFVLVPFAGTIEAVSYTHLTLPTNSVWCRSRWSPYH